MMDQKKTEEDDCTIIDLNTERIKKNVLKETHSDCIEAVVDFLDKYKNDTLTGL